MDTEPVTESETVMEVATYRAVAALEQGDEEVTLQAVAHEAEATLGTALDALTQLQEKELVVEADGEYHTT